MQETFVVGIVEGSILVYMCFSASYRQVKLTLNPKMKNRIPTVNDLYFNLANT